MVTRVEGQVILISAYQQAEKRVNAKVVEQRMKMGMKMTMISRPFQRPAQQKRSRPGRGSVNSISLEVLGRHWRFYPQLLPAQQCKGGGEVNRAHKQQTILGSWSVPQDSTLTTSMLGRLRAAASTKPPKAHPARFGGRRAKTKDNGVLKR